MAQLDAHRTGDQVAGTILDGSVNILSWKLSMKYFLVTLSLLLIQERQLAVSGANTVNSRYFESQGSEGTA